MNETEISLAVHGANVTKDTVEEAGRAMIGLLDAITDEMGHPPLGWKLGPVKFKCDGCGRRQDLDASREGWTHRSGDDFCPACSEAAR